MVTRIPVRLPTRVVPRRPIAAPTRPLTGFDLPTLVQMFEDLQGMHTTVLDAAARVERAHKHFADIKQGPPGLPGGDGKDGQSATSVTLEQVVEALRPDILAAVKKIKPQKGEKGDSPNMATLIDTLLEQLRSGNRRLGIEHIVGADSKFKEMDTRIRRTQGAGGMRGGGDTVVAGTGVTITNTLNGNKQINATAAGLTIVTVTGTIDDTNVAFTSTSQPTLLCINGTFYQKTGGAYTWTYSGGNITISSPVGTGGTIFGIK